MSQQKKIIADRYPGPKPFEENERDLFFGRSLETEALFESVSVHKVFVLHAESGLGKSSLIAAGLIPRLRTGKFMPVLIRFKDRKTSPGRTIIEAIHESLKRKRMEEDVPVAINPEEDHDVWKLIKKINSMDIIPILIFDQFEEFNYFTDAIKKETIRILSELVALRVPDYIRKEYAADRSSLPEGWYAQPELKIMFSIRTDRIGVMEEFADAIPETRTNRYELTPLMADQGEQVVILPAAMDATEDIQFNCQPFQYEPKLINTILEIVKRKNNTIDTTQLQIICLEIQERVKTKIASSTGMVMVTEEELGGRKGLEDLVKNFYTKQLDKISQNHDINPGEYLAIRILLEKKLIVQRKKDRLSEESIFQHFRNKEIKEERIKPLLDELLTLRLIRGLDFEASTFYEIAHDTLIDPILLEMQNREMAEKLEKEKKQADELAREQAEKLRKQRLETAKEVELRKKAIEAELHAKEEEGKAKEAELKAREAEKKATAAAEELKVSLDKLRESTRKQKRMQRVISIAVVLFFLVGVFLLYYMLQGINSKKQIQVLTAYKLLITGDSAYNAYNHRIAATNYFNAAKSGSDEAEKRIDSLIFSPVAWPDSNSSREFLTSLKTNIAYTPDHKLCIVTDNNKRGTVWDLSQTDPRTALSIPDVNLPLFSTANNFLQYFGSDSTPRILNLKTKKPLSLIPANFKTNKPIKVADPEYAIVYNYSKLAYYLSDNHLIINEKDGFPYIISMKDTGSNAYYEKLADFIPANPADICLVKNAYESLPVYPSDVENPIQGSYRISADGRFFSSLNSVTRKLFIYDIEKKSQVLYFKDVMQFEFHPDHGKTLFCISDIHGNLFLGDSAMNYNIISAGKGNKSLFRHFRFSDNGEKLLLIGKGSYYFNYSYNFKDSILSPVSVTGYGSSKSPGQRAMSNGDIFITTPDYRDFFISNITNGKVIQTSISDINNCVVDRQTQRVYFTDKNKQLHIINSLDMTELGTMDSVNAKQLFFDLAVKKLFYNDSLTNAVIAIDISSGQKKSIAFTTGRISGAANGLLELTFTKAGYSTGTCCLISPEKLALAGEEKTDYLRKLFSIKDVRPGK